MTDRSLVGLIGILLVVGFIMFIMCTPHPDGSTAAKVRETVRTQIHETSDRLGNAFDAARKDIEREKGR
jgi:hypothetical protein